MARQHRSNGNQRSPHARALPRKRAGSTQTLRPYASVGVAVVGAGLIAATPVTAPSPAVHQMREVALTTGSGSLPDLLAPWIAQYNTASENSTALMNAFFVAPGVGMQQMAANMAGYLQDFFNDPTSNSVTSISTQMQNNLSAVQTGYGLQGANTATTDTVLSHTLDGNGNPLGSDPGHLLMFNEAPGYLPAGTDPATVMPIIDFLASPESGIIMGMLGPSISPWVALLNSMTAGDDGNTTLANMVGAYFNGATLNLDSLLPMINGFHVFPPGMTMENLDIAFGGLLSAGSVGPDSGVGGSIFNSVGLDFSGVPVLGTLDLPGQAVGPLGAWEGWAQTIASLLGWDGSGSPLSGVTLPTIPTDFFDDGGASAMATDVSGWLQDLGSWL
ncbi:outer membrane porin GjpA [Mycobacterium sp. SVM_VP21]|nr:outer membrane porin GjpA [Mycobacterium sp. SVM_VP21]